MQRWILSEVLEKLPNSAEAHGGVIGRSIVTNARAHLGASCLLKLDIEDFYGSVAIGFGISAFQKLGYPRDVSISLAQFCFEDGKLPQGAATSPALANLSCEILDKRMANLATKYGLVFTRYFDDLTFSGPFINTRLIEIASEILSASGFALKPEKTRLLRGGSTKYVTGISVGGDSLRLPRSTRRRIRNAAHLLLKTRDAIGFAEAAGNPLVVESLLGSVAFWRHVEPNDQAAQELFAGLTKLRRDTDAPVELPPAWRPAPIPEVDPTPIPR